MLIKISQCKLHTSKPVLPNIFTIVYDIKYKINPNKL